MTWGPIRLHALGDDWGDALEVVASEEIMENIFTTILQTMQLQGI